MCYSKEFSLVSSVGMGVSSAYFWLKFVRLKYLSDEKMKARAIQLRPFIVNAILAYLCIAGHQAGEFFSILTNDQLIYKLGLISSILSVYFGSKALEKLTKIRIFSNIILAIIILVSIDIFRTTFVFENRHFWVRGDNHRVWSTMWFTLWTYAMISGVYISFFYKEVINKNLLRWAFLGVMNVSFVFSLLYAVLGSLSTNFVTCTQQLFDGFVFGKDFPSIWCTFSVVQAPFIYFGFLAFASYAVLTDTPRLNPNNDWRRAGSIALLTIGVMGVLKVVAPILFSVSWKMITK